MAAVRLPCFFFFLFSLSSSLPDYQALLQLKKSFDHTDKLDSWVPSSSPCDSKTSWNAIVCVKGIIVSIHLTGLGLSGKIDVESLQGLRGLRSISLTNNSFSGPIPEFNRLTSLRALYLSGNKFSGEIPSNYFQNMTKLKKVWLSGNNFNGSIPLSLSNLTHLLELHLENNKFSGGISSIRIPTLTSLNLSYNELVGTIPAGMAQFDASSFEGNSLCGEPLEQCSNVAQGPVSSPQNSAKESFHSRITVILISVVVAIALICGFATIVSSRRREDSFNVLGKENMQDAVEVNITGSSRRAATESNRKGSDSVRNKGSHHRKNSMGDLVIINEERGVFGLPDLMKAAAEVLGNGGLGSAYKAVMANGVSVVVKRLREMNRLMREGFDTEIRRVGMIRHQNILTPLAYHYRREEKLLVSEFVPKGSLLYVLHGDRGVCHAELNWPTRLKIILGIADGMSFLHTEYASSDLPHGNLKSSNVLLGENFEPLLTDFAFHQFINPSQAPQALFAYKSPEAIQWQRVSPKSDVYCLGIIILEILTGKFPSQYLSNGKGGTDVVQWVQSAIAENREAEFIDPEITAASSSLKQIEALLHIGAACTESNPEQRLDMREAIRRIEGIRV